MHTTVRQALGGSMEAYVFSFKALLCGCHRKWKSRCPVPAAKHCVHPESGWWKGDPCYPQMPPVFSVLGPHPGPAER